MDKPTTIAVFDFDHTLVAHDSFWRFVAAVAGWPKTLLALALGLGCWFIDKNNSFNQDVSFRTYLKQQLINRLLAGRTSESLQPAIEKLKQQQVELPSAQKLRDHYAAGHHVVIASGGLNLYLPHLLDKLPHHALICTEIGTENHIITGTMMNGNCVGARKAELVQTYLANQPAFTQSWGYGNYPYDLPMLDLMNNRLIV